MGGVPHNYQNVDDKPRIANVAGLHFMTNWCKLHDTSAHLEVNCPKMEKMVKIAQVDSQSSQSNSNKDDSSVDTAMIFETVEEVYQFPM
jgi:hypothetical protein